MVNYFDGLSTLEDQICVLKILNSVGSQYQTILRAGIENNLRNAIKTLVKFKRHKNDFKYEAKMISVDINWLLFLSLNNPHIYGKSIEEKLKKALSIIQ